MKVLCINDRFWGVKTPGLFGFGSRTVKTPGPEYGDIDQVVDQMVLNGETYYVLKDWSEDAFEADQFIPISEIDETEFEREIIGQLTA